MAVSPAKQNGADVKIGDMIKLVNGQKVKVRGWTAEHLLVLDTSHNRKFRVLYSTAGCVPRIAA